MQKVSIKKAAWLAGLLLAAGVASILFSSAVAEPGGVPIGQAPTDPWEMFLFGGPGDQLGQSITVRGSQIIVGAQDDRAGGGILRSYEIPLGITYQWTLSQPGQWDTSVTTTGTNLYVASAAYPPACGAVDGVGGTEGKVRFAKYTLTGNPEGCWSYNFFPYTGGEGYQAAAASNEGGTDYIYAAGWGEQMGWGYSLPFLLTKYDTAGKMLNKVSEPGIGWEGPPGYVGLSRIDGLAVLNGYIYTAGGSGLMGLGEDNGGLDYGQRPVIMKYDFNLNRSWKVRATPVSPSYPGYAGWFHGVTTLHGDIYVVGGAVPAGGTGGFDYIIEKFNAQGERVWSASWGGSYDDVLKGVVAVGDRLFAVGYSYETSYTAGLTDEADAVLFEISPVNGSILMSDRFGGEKVERANAVATDGHDLYIVGESRSYDSSEQNVVGQNEIMLIHYRLNRVFAFTGFYRPIDNQPVVNSAKAGSTVPVKWRITDLDGTPIADPASFKSLTSVTCEPLTGDPANKLDSAGRSGLQYFGDGYWQFNWTTVKSYAGQCRVMILTLADGSTHTAYFKFK